MKTSLLSCSLALCVAATPILAQNSRPSSRATQGTVSANAVSRSAIELHTTDKSVAAGMLRAFQSEAELPELGEGGHYIVSLDAEADCSVRTGQGNVGWMKGIIRPAVLMKAYEDEIGAAMDQSKDQVVGMMGMFGIKAKDGNALIDNIMNFPKQVAAVHLNFPEDLKETLKGKHFSIGVAGVPGTWFGKVIDAMVPLAQGAPVLEGKDPVFTMSAAVESSGLHALMTPLYSFVASLGARNDEEKAANAKMMLTLSQLTDGSMCIVGDPFSQTMMTLTGIKDGAKAQKVLHSDAYAEMQRKQMSIIPMADVEIEPNALVHRDVKVSKTTMEMEAGTGPQTNTTYTGVAGSYMVSYSGEKESGVKTLIDMVLDQKVKRKPLQGGALMTLMLNLEKLVDNLADFGIPAEFDAERFPTHVFVNMRRNSNVMTFKVRFKG